MTQIETNWPYLDYAVLPMAHLDRARRINKSLGYLQVFDRVLLDLGAGGVSAKSRYGHRSIVKSEDYSAENNSRQLTIYTHNGFIRPTLSRELIISPEGFEWRSSAAESKSEEQMIVITENEMLESGIPHGFAASARAAGSWATLALRNAAEYAYDVPDAAITSI